MKLYKSSHLLLLACTALLAGCSENSWNDHLDGFEKPGIGTGVENVTYTLTDADYKSIASNSANKALATTEEAQAALSAIGKNGCFANEEQARLYLPAFLGDQNFPYFNLANGSGIKVEYNIAEQIPETVARINEGVPQYRIDEQGYQYVWGSDDDYINAFAPMKPASKGIPQVLADVYDDAEDGDMIYVNYNETGVNPIFGTVGGGDVPEWTMTDVIGTSADGSSISIRGIVTGICTRGFIVTDASGSILCYQASGFDMSAVSIGSHVNVDGSVSKYNDGLQIAITAENYNVVDEGTYDYPAPVVYDAAKMTAAASRTGDFTAEYITFTATVKETKNGDRTYTNLIVDGLENPQGSAYQVPSYFKEMMVDGTTHKFTGYFVAVSGSSTKYINLLITDIDGKKSARRRVVRRAPVGEIASTAKAALYQFSGNTWKEVANTVVLQPSDYTAMGYNYGNFSGTVNPALIPTWLRNSLPYAADGDKKNVVYLYYANEVTSVEARQYILSEGEWKANPYMQPITDQFVRKDNVWMFNPSVELTLPYERNTDPSYTYYMACVEWVYENICVPMGDTSITSGKYFIDYRGNAEFYSGASAYYGNVDIRASSAKSHMPEGYKGYDGLSDDQITLLMKKRFSTEVLPAALKKLHSDAAPIEGMEVTYTIHFTAYDGAASEETIVYTVTAPAEFTYTSSTWASDGQDADWK